MRRWHISSGTFVRRCRSGIGSLFLAFGSGTAVRFRRHSRKVAPAAFSARSPTRAAAQWLALPSPSWTRREAPLELSPRTSPANTTLRTCCRAPIPSRAEFQGLQDRRTLRCYPRSEPGTCASICPCSPASRPKRSPSPKPCPWWRPPTPNWAELCRARSSRTCP